MPDFSTYKNLELPKSVEKYNVAVANKNNMVIDSELHKLDLKNESQDNLLATKEALNSEIARATGKENELEENINNESERAQLAENNIAAELASERNRAMTEETAISNNLSAMISELATRLNTIADSDDATLDQLSEIVAYIKNNKDLIDGITTGKVNVSDIIDNLTSTDTDKPLSANQGKVLKSLITDLTSIVGNKVDKVSGKGLSTNDYTTSERDKLLGIASGAEVNVQPDWNVTDTTSDSFIKNKPTIPTKTSDLINDSNFITENGNTSMIDGSSLQNQIGNLAELETEEKGSLTGAVNEVAERLQDEIEDTQIKIDSIRVFHMEATASYANSCYTITPMSINSKSPSEYVKKIGDIIVVEILKNTSSANVTNKVYQTRIKNLNSGTTEKIYATNANNNDAAYEAMTNLDGCPILFLAIRKRPNSSELIYTLLNEPTFKPLPTYQYLDYVDNPSLRPFSVEGANELWNNTMKCVETGRFTNDTIYLGLKSDATYLLITREITISTGKVYGYRARMYATTGGDGITAPPSAANLCASTNAGVTLSTNPTSSQWLATEPTGIVLKATATYQVSYALYEFHNSYGKYIDVLTPQPATSA